MRRHVVGTLVVMAIVATWVEPGRAQMPDPRMMSGQIIPAPEVPAGTVTVRMIRQTIMNVISDVDVELHGAGAVRHASTGADGRATFTGLPVGAHVHAVAVVDNERLQSIEFEVPAQGGVRTILAAGVGVGTPVGGTPVGGAAPPPAATTSTVMPAPAGSLVLGGDTRFAVEFQDDTLTIFYLLDLINQSGGPVMPAAPLVIDLPAGASGASIMEGGSKAATVSGSRVTITGPLPPGVTQVPIAFRLESWNDPWVLQQQFPLPVATVAFAAQKLGDMRLSGPQTPTVRETVLQGTPFIVATGGRLPAGTPLSVTLSGVPHRSRMPVYFALTVAAAIAVWGAWQATGRDGGEAARRDARTKELVARRERGLSALAALELQRRQGEIDEQPYVDRRAQLLGQLELVYGELDGVGELRGSGHGTAA